MKNTHFEIQKTNTNTNTNTNINTNYTSAAIPKLSTLHSMYDENHITKQKTNKMPLHSSNQMSLWSLQSSDKLIRHNPAATSEWDNSSYCYLKGESQVSPVVDKATHQLLKLFFNSRPKNIDSKSSMFKHRSILKTYVGIPRVKTSINRARITVYKYDRQNVYHMNMLNKSFTLWPNKKGSNQDKKGTRRYSSSVIPISFNTAKPQFNLKKTDKLIPSSRNKAIKPSIYNIRYVDLPVSNKSRVTKRKTNIKAIDTSIQTSKIKNRKGFFGISSSFNTRKSTSYKKRISWAKQRILKKKVQKAKKRILLNILRNKTFHHVLSGLRFSFKSKPSVLLLKKIENYSISYIDKIKSLKLFLNSFSLMPTSYSAPNLLVTLWNKMSNSSNPLSTFSRVSFEKKTNAAKKLESISPVLRKRKMVLSMNMNNQLIIPSLRVGKFLGKIYKKIRPSTSIYTTLWVSYMKSNNTYLSRLNHILMKRYLKRISLNIVDLKYLYLDSNIMASAITTKLKDRKKRVLRVLKRVLGLIKKPYFKIHFYNRKKTLEQVNNNFLFMDQNLNMLTSSKNILYNKYLFKKPRDYKPRLSLYHLNHKTVTGVRLQGTGRLTRRLTASRSISKFKYMGSLQNLESSRQAISTVMLRGYMKSNLQYTNINSYNRNGAFGVKVSVSSY